MEGNFITIALIGTPAAEKNTLYHRLIQRSVSSANTLDFPVLRGTYRYWDEDYLLLNLPEIASLPSHTPTASIPLSPHDQSCRSAKKSKRLFTCRKPYFSHGDEYCPENLIMQLLSSGRIDIFLVVCNVLCLEQGLRLLSQLLKLPAVKEQAIPTVFCIDFHEDAQAMGIVVDFDLLEDVLQIPVLPCYPASSTCIDDIKTAVSAVWRRLFSYECLDFSPKKLTAETISWLLPENRLLEKHSMETGSPGLFVPDIPFLRQLSLTEKLNLFCLILSLLLLLFWLILTGAHVPSLCLWRILYWIKRSLP